MTVRLISPCRKIWQLPKAFLLHCRIFPVPKIIKTNTGQDIGIRNRTAQVRVTRQVRLIQGQARELRCMPSGSASWNYMTDRRLKRQLAVRLHCRQRYRKNMMDMNLQDGKTMKPKSFISRESTFIPQTCIRLCIPILIRCNTRSPMIWLAVSFQRGKRIRILIQ